MNISKSRKNLKVDTKKDHTQEEKDKISLGNANGFHGIYKKTAVQKHNNCT